MANNDANRSRRTYSFYRTPPQAPSQGTTVLVGGDGINVEGDSNQITISATGGSGGGADPNADYVLMGVTGSLPNSRALTVGAGLFKIDGGPAANVLIYPSPSMFLAVASGSLLWSSTTWTDVTNVAFLENSIYVADAHIARSGSTFTVDSTGWYQFHASFNAYASGSMYLAMRLSGSLFGTMLQRTVRANNASPGHADQVPFSLDGIVFMQAGDPVALQYVRKGGTPVTWTVSDPIDGEEMKTGEVSMFLLGPQI